MSDYSVSLQFTADMAALLPQLQSLIGQVAQLTENMQGAQGGIGGLGATGSASLGELAGAFSIAELATDAFEKTIELAKEAVRGLFEGFKEFTKEGFTFNTTIEQARIGVGALIATQNEIKDSSGRMLEGQEKLNVAMSLGADAVNKIRLGSFQTIATFQQLVAAYQQGLGPMQAAGVELKDTTALTIKFAQAAGALGLDMNTLGTELRATFGGQISARMTKVASSLHIKNEDIKAWAEAGTLVKNMNDRLVEFGYAGDMIEASWKGVTSNVQHFFEAFSGEIVQPAWEQIKTGLHEALHDAFDLSTGEFSSAFSGIIQTGKDLFSDLGSLAGDAIKSVVDGVKEISAWLGKNRESVKGIFDGFTSIAREVGGVLADIIRVAFQIEGAKDASLPWGDILKVVALEIAQTRDAFRTVVQWSDALGASIDQQVLGPLAAMLEGLGKAASYLGMKDSGASMTAAAENIRAQLEQEAKLVNASAQVKSSVEELTDSWKKQAEASKAEVDDSKLNVDQLKGKLGSLKSEIKSLEAAQKAAIDSGKAMGQELTERGEKLLALREEEGKLEKLLGVTTKARGLDDGKDKAQKNEQAAIALQLEKEINATSERTTLEEKQQLELKQLQVEIEQKRLAISQAKGDEATKAKNLAALTELEADKKLAIDRKYSEQRASLEKDLQNKLSGAEEGGLQQRVAAINASFTKIREENRKLGADAISEQRIQAAQQAEIDRARIEQVKHDLGELKKELSELAQIKGRALTLQEQNELLAQFAQRSETARAASQKFREEMHLDETAAQGWNAGLKEVIAQNTSSWTTWKNTAVSMMNTVKSTMASALQGMMSGQMTFSNGMKAIWKGIVQAVTQALAEILAQFVVTKIAETLVQKKSSDAAKDEAAAKQMSAAAGMFAADSGIPIVGPIIAAAGVALMNITLGANAATSKAIARKTGGIAGLNGPELTVLGDGGTPEVVAPPSDFADFAYNYTNLGARLQGAIERSRAKAASYQAMASSFARDAARVEPAARPSDQVAPGHTFQLSFPGAFIADTSFHGMQKFGEHAMDAIMVASRSRGVVLQPGDVFGRLS